MTTVDLIYFVAGGGHRSAATALCVAMESDRSWQPRLLNLQELLDSIDLSRRVTGVRMQDSYNLMLKKNWTLGSGQMLPVLHAFIRLYHGAEADLIEKHWRKGLPDLVVSLVPHFNRALLAGLRRVTYSVPFVTILTDFADYPPHFWIEPQEQFFICGSERAAQQARMLGVPTEWIYQTSGMIVHPRFYQPLAIDREAEKQRLGLDPALPTGLVMFGGHGSRAMLEIAARLDKSDLDLQLIFICGRNERLARVLRGKKKRLRFFVEGFTAQIPYYMSLSDFFIGKPGPGSLSEALLMKLPVIVERNGRTLPQERFNTEWIVEKQVGIVVSSFRSIERAVEEMLSAANLERYRANAAALNNRAVFECEEILRRIAEAKQMQAIV
jgi:Glycosyltransferase family 28 C-terminal domain/Monogalactosyldiacylglycerol (MGDG) synthase